MHKHNLLTDVQQLIMLLGQNDVVLCALPSGESNFLLHLHNYVFYLHFYSTTTTQQFKLLVTQMILD